MPPIRRATYSFKRTNRSTTFWFQGDGSVPLRWMVRGAMQVGTYRRTLQRFRRVVLLPMSWPQYREPRKHRMLSCWHRFPPPRWWESVPAGQHPVLPWFPVLRPGHRQQDYPAESLQSPTVGPHLHSSTDHPAKRNGTIALKPESSTSVRSFERIRRSPYWWHTSVGYRGFSRKPGRP